MDDAEGRDANHLKFIARKSITRILACRQEVFPEFRGIFWKQLN
jgi:hypothetical protein